MSSRKPNTVRFMSKNGRCNIRQNAEEKRQRYINDIFNTLIDMSWRNNLLFFVSTYIITWSLCGFLWWVIALVRGDLSNIESPFGFGKRVVSDTNPNISESINATMSNMTVEQDDTKCANNVHSYWSAFLFFVETETSVGYGKRAVTDKCPEAVLLFVVQALLGSILDSFMVGCIYIKIAQPKNRAETLVFSETCTISPRDGKFCLMFRVANLRNSLIVQSRIRAKFVKSRETLEGEFIGLHQDDINVGFDSGADNLFLVTPLIISHEINSKSPFYDMDAEYIKNEPFEIIVILEGLQESTGMICQARTSYLSSEVLWGHRFVPVLSYDVSHFRVDHAEFHKTYEVSMPKISMHDYELMGTRHVQASSSVLSVRSLAVPGKLGNGHHHNNHGNRKKDSVKTHSSVGLGHQNVTEVLHNKFSLPNSNSVPATHISPTVINFVNENKIPSKLLEKCELGTGSEVWPDTSLIVKKQNDDISHNKYDENIVSKENLLLEITQEVHKNKLRSVSSNYTRSKIPQSRSASNLSLASSQNYLENCVDADSRLMRRTVSGGSLSNKINFQNSAFRMSIQDTKSHVEIPFSLRQPDNDDLNTAVKKIEDVALVL